MLQQTVVATVVPYYAKFLASYPRIENLAAADVVDVCGHWAGLGYYARARNLHKCAQAVVARGGFPRSIAELRELPGIGPYTANAIGALAFGLPVLPVDGNVERVAARMFAVTAKLPQGKKEISGAAQLFMADAAAQAAPGDFVQALFDLGAGICTPKAPDCSACPWAGHCLAHANGLAAALPARAPKPVRPHREGVAYVLLDDAGDVFLIRRPPNGLLGGMLALPEAPPVATVWAAAGAIEHMFTHFSLTLHVLVARCGRLPGGALRAPAASAALPSVMRKALDAGCRALNHVADEY